MILGSRRFLPENRQRPPILSPDQRKGAELIFAPTHDAQHFLPFLPVGGRNRTRSSEAPWRRTDPGVFHRAMAALEIDAASLYERLAQRDDSLDGVIYVGVKTTGIYCRPVCRARLPFQRNLIYFPSAAAAEAEGFRPCLRCRPETVPFSPAWRGTRTSVDRALVLIEEGMLDRGSVSELAEHLGIGGRHLRRLFCRHLGATPTQVARTLRLQRARRLLDESYRSIREIAHASGFKSVRRMNAAFAEVYGRPPSTFRDGPRAQERGT